MKNILLYISTIFFLVSCAEEIGITENTESPSPSTKGIEGVVEDMPFDENIPETRSTLTFNATQGFLFAWEANDQLTVFPDGDGSNKGTFHLKTGEANKAISYFDGGGFTLTKDKLYYALSKSESTAPSSAETEMAIDLTTISNLKATYAGQTQSANGNSSHLGKFDYMAALAKAEAADRASFVFKHLGCNLFMDITFPESARGITFESVELYEAGKDEFRQPVRTINLKNGGSTPSTYSPAWNEPDMSGTPARFSLKLGESGFTVGSDKNLKLFIELPPFDFTSKTLVCHLNRKDKSDSNKDWFYTYTGKNFVAGKSYWIKPTAAECTQYNINVQLIQNWQKGNTVSQTRAIGDPGIEEKLDLPKYLYAYFINGGRLVQTATATDITENKWQKTEDGIYNYIGDWTFNVESGGKVPQGTKLALDNSYGTNPKVYIIASKEAITQPTVTLGSSGTTEDDVKAFTYTYTNQDFIKNLYSTPWAASDFTGELNSDYKDVKLYHVASKLDINWEASSAISGNVSVNNFQTTGLSYFKPSTGNTGSGTGKESTTITTGTAYNGRTVFYIPQPSSATYNITTGTGKTHDITFTRDEVFSSWFRGLITIK